MSEEQVQQAVKDIEAIRDSGVHCEWREEEYFDEHYVISRHLVLGFPGTKSVPPDAVLRLIKLNENPADREKVLRIAFERAGNE